MSEEEKKIITAQEARDWAECPCCKVLAARYAELWNQLEAAREAIRRGAILAAHEPDPEKYDKWFTLPAVQAAKKPA